MDEEAAEAAPFACVETGFRGRQDEAARESHRIARARRERGLVEVVEVEVLEPVAAPEGAEVLEMEIATRPRERRAIEPSASPVVPEQVAGAAKEREGVLRHRLVLEPQALGVA